MLDWQHHPIPVGAFWAGRDGQGRRAILRPGDHGWHVIAWAPDREPLVRTAADLELAQRVAAEMLAEVPAAGAGGRRSPAPR